MDEGVKQEELESLIAQEDNRRFLNDFRKNLYQESYDCEKTRDNFFRKEKEELEKIARALLRTAEEHFQRYPALIKKNISNIVAQELRVEEWLFREIFDFETEYESENKALKKHLKGKARKGGRLGELLEKSNTHRYQLIKKNSRVWIVNDEAAKEYINTFYAKPSQAAQASSKQVYDKLMTTTNKPKKSTTGQKISPTVYETNLRPDSVTGQAEKKDMLQLFLKTHQLDEQYPNKTPVTINDVEKILYDQGSINDEERRIIKRYLVRKPQLQDCFSEEGQLIEEKFKMFANNYSKESLKQLHDLYGKDI